jgi:hypothetical protein
MCDGEVRTPVLEIPTVLKAGQMNGVKGIKGERRNLMGQLGFE